MAFWAEIDQDYVPRFRRWHNCEHIPERVGIPGFLRGRRYQATDDLALFLMFYETADPAVLASEAYMTALNNPTPWTRESLSHFRNPARNVYVKRAEHGEAGANPAPYMSAWRFNLAGPGPDIFAGRLAERWLAEMALVHAVRRVRLYEVDESISAIVTSERKIYGKGPGAQRYLVLIEADMPHETWLGTVEAIMTRAEREDGAQRTDLHAEALWLDFGYVSPSLAATS